MEPTENVIRVDGHGTAEGAPDRASIEVGVSVIDRTVQKASARAANALSSVLKAIEDLGVDGRDLHTLGHSVRAEYDHTGRGRKLAGYRVSDAVRVTVREIDRLGPVVDAATAAGGDDVTVDRINFGIDDPRELEAVARERAWQSATEKATQLATLAGLQLGPAIAIRESADGGAAPVRMRTAMLSAPADAPIEAGTLNVDVRLGVTFAID